MAQRLIGRCGAGVRCRRVIEKYRFNENPSHALSILRDCHAAIEALIPRGYPALEQVAVRMGISVRTLQRRLHETGATFSVLVEQVRHELACRRLETTALQIGEVAKDLGFKDHSSFSRAFRRWTGMSPRTYRQSLQRAGDRRIGRNRSIGG